ncbi:MAG: radical SAM protein [Kiritimatiellae bacterium]|nr:radical SAM protein [Kiritimatiellia bacterium]
MSKDAQPTPYQNILAKTYEQRIPFTVHWELTYRCNLSCVHCYAGKNGAGAELTLKEVEDVLDQLVRAGCLFLVFTGGEIACRRDVMKILRLARERGFALRLMTNGTLLTQEMIETIGALEPLSVDISLYGMDPARHERITGVKGSWLKAVEAIKRCLSAGIPTAIKSVLMKYNAGEFSALRRFAADNGARFVFDYMLVPSDDGSAKMAEHGLSEDDLYAFLSANMPRERPAKRVAAADRARARPLCGAGSNALAISPFGDVFPCLAFRQSIGTLKSQRLRRILAAPVLDKFRKARYNALETCARCGLLPFCNRCSGVAWAECGDAFGAPGSACMAARAMKRAWETPAAS